MSLYYKTGFSLFKQWPLWSFRGWFKVSNVYLIKTFKHNLDYNSNGSGNDGKTLVVTHSGYGGQQTEVKGHRGQECAKGSLDDLLLDTDKTGMVSSTMLADSGQRGQQTEVKGHRGQECAKGTLDDLFMDTNKLHDEEERSNHKCNNQENSLLHELSADDRLEVVADGKHRNLNNIYLHCRSRQSVTIDDN